MNKSFWKIIIFFVDICLIIYTPLYLFYKLIPLFYSLMGRIIDRNIFDMNSANVFGIIFVITLFKILFGIIIFIILQVKYRQYIIKKNKKYNLLWIIFSIFIISYSIVLIINNTYNAYYNLFYSIYIIIGTFCWINVILNNINLNKIFQNIFVVFNLICNYLLIIIGFIISIY
jgi:hypothetical protein